MKEEETMTNPSGLEDGNGSREEEDVVNRTDDDDDDEKGQEKERDTQQSKNDVTEKETTAEEEESPKKVVLSKNQMKKRKRFEKLMAKKKAKKELEKARRIAKAKADGRDLEQERRDLEERTKSGEGHKKRQEEWLQRFSSAKDRFQICLDCSFDDIMTVKERCSLALQIRFMYASNKRSSHPISFSVCNLATDSTTMTQLKKVSGFPEQWTSKQAFDHSPQSVIKYYQERKINKDHLVYLTGDSDTTLEQLENDKIYIIGGIVDRNRHKFVTRDKAKELGIATAKLPLDSYWNSNNNESSATKILTCNHVFDILINFCEQQQQQQQQLQQENESNHYQNCWNKAFMKVLPKRKNIHDSLDDKE